MEQSTHLSWHTTNTTQSHKKTALAPDKQKQQTTHNKLNFHWHSLASPAHSTKSPDFVWGKVAPCTLAHNSCTSCTQRAHELCTSCAQIAHKLHTICTKLANKLIKSCTQSCTQVAHSWCTSWSQVARYSVSFPFQAVALGDSSTDLTLTHTMHKNSPTNAGAEIKSFTLLPISNFEAKSFPWYIMRLAFW